MARCAPNAIGMLALATGRSEEAAAAAPKAPGNPDGGGRRLPGALYVDGRPVGSALVLAGVTILRRSLCNAAETTGGGTALLLGAPLGARRPAGSLSRPARKPPQAWLAVLAAGAAGSSRVWHARWAAAAAALARPFGCGSMRAPPPSNRPPPSAGTSALAAPWVGARAPRARRAAPPSHRPTPRPVCGWHTSLLRPRAASRRTVRMLLPAPAARACAAPGAAGLRAARS